ncbi:MAG TPA: TfpX/TfpZ family type IV pilin accessory protein [Caldimonas sp.]|jgi:hypothetical protein
MKLPFSPRTRRARAAGIHLFASGCVAALVALVVFGLWYPPPYSTIAAGTTLFALLISVDVVLGPALTAIAADPGKAIGAFRRDLAVIVFLQLAGLTYGLYSIALARPVYLAFEVDRMRVVTAADIDPATLLEAPPQFRALPWTGPRLIAAVRPTDPDEVLRSIDLALGGIDISMTPKQWRDVETQREAMLRVSRPATDLEAKYPSAESDLAKLATRSARPLQALRFLPVLGRHSSTVVVIAPPDASIVGFLPYDGFF